MSTSPYLRYQTPLLELYQGNALSVLRTMPDNSVHCCVTSPPYYGLRDYLTGKWVGGDSACDHQGKPLRARSRLNQNCGTGRDVKNALYREVYRTTCGKCGARRVDLQIGLESSVEQYIKRLTRVFREVRRVLRPDGVCWVNIGDSYAGSWKGGEDDPKRKRVTSETQRREASRGLKGKVPKGLKPKDLIGVPWMLAFALRADGWYLRQEIIWEKPNCMPSSVADRCTTAHESLFVLTKSAKYYWDKDAIAEPIAEATIARMAQNIAEQKGSERGNGGAKSNGNMKAVGGAEGMRNKRSVWRVPVRGFADAHFATFPRELVRPCLLATCPEDGVALDPFSGSSTTGEEALAQGKRYKGIDLNPDFIEMAWRRLVNVDLPLFGAKDGF